MGKYFFGRTSADTDFHAWGPNRGAQFKFGNDKQVIRLDGADGIVYSTDKKGWPGDFLQSIGSFSSDFGNRDTLFLMNRQDGETAVALKNKHASQMKSTTFYGIPELYVNAYALHKNDEPIVGTNDGYVDTHIKDGLFDYNDYKNYENVKYQGENVKGIACPGTTRRGFINNTHIRCVYNDTELRNFSSIKDQYSNSPKRQDIYEKALKSFCKIEANAGKSIDDKRKCIDVINDNEKRNYCFKENRMSNDSVCSKSSLGNSYEILAKEYCENNPDKEFCACYNVLNNKCLTEETKDLPGCKVTYPTRETINNMPAEYSSNFEGTDKCWGNVCAAGTGKYVPEGTIDALCSKTVAVCIADLDVGSLKESGVNIEQNCGSNNQTNQTTNGSTEGTPAPMKDIPLTTTTTPSPSSSESNDEEGEEEKAFYEKTEVQIGAGAFSSISCLFSIMLLIIALM